MRRLVIIGMAVALALGVVGCGPDPTPPASTAKQSPPPSSAVTSTNDTTETAPPASVVTTKTTPSKTPTPSAAPKVDTAEDGVHHAKVASANRKNGVWYAAIDYVQFYTGDTAWSEAAKDGDEAPNDYYVRNTNTKLRTFPVKTGLNVRVETMPGTFKAISMTDWHRYLEMSDLEASEEGDVAILARASLFIFTIKNGEIVKAQSIWVP